MWHFALYLEKLLSDWAEIWIVAGETLAETQQIFGLENRMKSRQIINDDIWLPFYYLFILGSN